MYEQLGMLDSMGMTVESDGEWPKMPQIAWHDARSRFPGDTIAEAMRLCEAAFSKPPRIIFVNLPTTAVDLYQVRCPASASL